MKLLAALASVLVVVAAALAQGGAEPRADWLKPKLHLIYGQESGDPVRAYFERTRAFDEAKLEIKSVGAAGVQVRSWRRLEAFGKPLLEVEFAPKPGVDANFDSLRLVTSDGKRFDVPVGPNRVLYLKPKDRYEINFEVMEQLPNERLYLGMRVFNDAEQPVTIERLIYAPSAAATGRILLNPAYDGAWFAKLEAWSRAVVAGAGALPPLPAGARYADAGRLNLKVLPSRGFSAAIVEPSLKAGYSCLRAAQKPPAAGRRDNAFLQGIIEYRVGDGPKQLYPLPDQVFADVCF